MAVIEQSYDVKARGIGRKDYTLSVERSTSALYTPTMRQEIFIMRYAGILPTLPYPSVYLFIIPMPQEDGTWGWEASSIVMHFAEISVTIGSNHLALTGLIRWASLDDYFAFIVAENFPQMYGYGATYLSFTVGIPTQPGSVYTVVGAFWSTNPAEQMSMVANGLITDLTRDWMFT